ncbi:MAG: hypothetical protein NTV86_18040 [Planctomycetota bacterium]|nr:hypothetical protein [Planctomycetota bacterium]
MEQQKKEGTQGNQGPVSIWVFLLPAVQSPNPGIPESPSLRHKHRRGCCRIAGHGVKASAETGEE